MGLTCRYDRLSFSEKKRVRLKYINDQKGLCFHCGNPLRDDPPREILSKQINWSKFPKGFLDHKIHLHHCHKTGMTEGAVHAYCNAVLFQYYGK